MAAVLLAIAFYASDLTAQSPRASVSASEVNGTFRYSFKGKYKDSSNEIKIWALGKGKLKIAFDLVYPFTDGTGELSANLGQAVGTAAISGDKALYTGDDDAECRITMKFVKPGTIKVDQDGGSACGFGHNVSAAGTYTRVSKSKPDFRIEP